MIENVVILGKGPAAYVAAIYTATAGLKPLIIEEHTPSTEDFNNADVIPGICEKLTNSEYISRIKEQAKRFNVRFEQRVATAVLVNEVITIKFEDGSILTKTCIIDDYDIYERLLGFKSEKSIVKGQFCASITGTGIFLCGSASVTEKMAIILAGSGCAAGLDAEHYIENDL